MPSTPYTIALLGMNEKGLSTFSYFIEKQASHYVRLAAADKATLFITDFDSEAGISQWHQYCKGHNKSSIVLAFENPNKERSLWVKKPVSSNELLKAIKQLIELEKNPKTVEAVANSPIASPDKAAESKINTGYQREFNDSFSPNLTLSKDEIAECCGIRSDLAITHPDFENMALFSEQKTLLNSIKNAIAVAKEKNLPVYLTELPFNFVILPSDGRIYVDLNNRNLRHLCAMPLQKAPVIKIAKSAAIDYKSAFKMPVRAMPSIDKVLWQTSLWTARGRLSNHIKADAPMRLHYWPNFTELAITPYAIQIAALWTAYDLSPIELSEKLNIPQRFVFAFASAASAVDLVEQKVSALEQLKIDWKPKNHLFSSILRSLKIA